MKRHLDIHLSLDDWEIVTENGKHADHNNEVDKVCVREGREGRGEREGGRVIGREVERKGEEGGREWQGEGKMGRGKGGRRRERGMRWIG